MESLLTLRLLANIITDEDNTMERVYMESDTPLSSLDATFDRNDPAEVLRQHLEVSLAIKDIVAAAGQITAVVSEPVRMLVSSAHAFHVSCCLRTASELNIVCEAGPEGAHLKEIAAPSQTDPKLIGRILRLLATHHIFREISPGVFTNNRISSALDKGKPSSVLFQKSRTERLTGTSGTAALVEMAGDLTLKASAFLADTLLQPEPQKLPYNVAFRTDAPVFEELNRPKNAYDLNRFAVAMRGTADAPEIILQGFDWVRSPLEPSSSMSAELSKAHCKERFPKNNRLILFQVHDFFTPQAVNEAAVFLVRHIIHDWPDAQAISILQHLRRAATPTTKLLLIEKTVPQVSGDQSRLKIRRAAHPCAPPPLLPNWGVASAEIYAYDMSVSTVARASCGTYPSARCHVPAFHPYIPPRLSALDIKFRHSYTVRKSHNLALMRPHSYVFN
ncbi:hypothetical protein C8R44DRAFT_883386 [Mycena epipterygia]|nr:hypothetical protein C8R44DRAFT_883386 [Mycena epipterygia]